MSSKRTGQTTSEGLEHKKHLYRPQQLTSTEDQLQEGCHHKMPPNQRQVMTRELEQHGILKSELLSFTDDRGEEDHFSYNPHIKPKKQNKELKVIQEYDTFSELDLIAELKPILPPNITSEQFDSLRIQLSILHHCSFHEWDEKSSELKLCISRILEAIHNYQIKEFCNMIKIKWRPSPRTDIKQPDTKDKNKQTLAMISECVTIHNGAVIYSSDELTLQCYKGAECSQTINCCSLVTDMTRVGTTDKVIATLSFKKKIIIISPTGSQLLSLRKGYHKISYVEGSKFVGSPMFSKSLYLVDWRIKLEDGIVSKFEIKDYPSNIAVGPRQRILTTFAYISCIACYNLKGDLLFELDSVSDLPLKMPTQIIADHTFFYIIESEEKRMNRVSALGGASQVKIPIVANSMAINKNTIILWDSFGESHILETGEHFWPNQIYFHRAQTPTIDRQVCIYNTTDIRAVLMLSDSRLVIIYWNRQIKLIDADNIDETLLDSLELNSEPTAFCRWNLTQILVTFSENKEIQFISWKEDNLKNKYQLNTEVGYVQVTSKAINEVVGLTISPQPQVHMILSIDDRVTVIAIINLEHSSVSIAASPVNLLVADTNNCKLVFYSFRGKQLSTKKLKIKHRPWLVYANGSHFYVVSNSKPSVDCYDICGQFEQEFEFTSHCLPQIGVLNGTVSVVNTVRSRVLLYRHHNWDRCQVQVKRDSDSDSDRTVDLRYGKRQEKKVVIGSMCLLLDGQMVIADWGEFQLLLISQHGDLVKQHPLPSLATDICRWGSNQFGVVLPLKKQLWLFKSNSFDNQVISFTQPYIRVCQFDDTRAVCYCDRPSCLDLVTVKGPSHGTVIHITDSPDYIKSIAVRHNTKDILTWDSKCLLSYNITNNSPKDTIFQQTQSPLGGGCTDETLLYVTNRKRIFSLTGDSQVIKEYFSGDKLGVIDQVDVLSGYVVVTELLSSTVHFQDLAGTERGYHYNIPSSKELDTENIIVSDVAITDNNLIAVCDKSNKNLKFLSFKGMLLDTLPLESPPKRLCQWTPNTLAVTLRDKNTLLTVKVQFPLSYTSHNTVRPYKHIATLSDGRLVCSWEIGSLSDRKKYGIDIVNIEEDTFHLHHTTDIQIRDVTVTHQDIIAVAFLGGHHGGQSRFSFFKCSGEKLYEVDNTITQIYKPYSISSDDTYIYATGELAVESPNCVVCLSHGGRYNHIFLHHTQPIMPNSKGRTNGEFRVINCKGPRIVVSTGFDSLYVQGLNLDRETFPVSRLQGDASPVNIKDLDISAQGKTIVCDMVNNVIKLFTCDGQLICHRNHGVLAGGLCLLGETQAMVTIPQINQLFSLDLNSLDIVKRWNTQVPYQKIRRLNHNLFLCSINLKELHIVKVVGDTLEIMVKHQLFNQYPFSLPPDMSEKEKEETDSKDGTCSTGRNSSTGRERRLDSRGLHQNDGRQRLIVRCGNYVASSRVGSDTISVRQLPWRTSLFNLPIKSRYDKIRVTLLTDDTAVISDFDNKTITLLTLEGHVLHKISTDTGPGGVCQWTDDTFIVTFFESKALVLYSKKYPLSPIRTIPTTKGYDYICKNKDNHLVCCARGDSYYESGVAKYRGGYMDILSPENVIYSCTINDGLVLDIGVTQDSVVVLKGILGDKASGYIDTRPVLCWYWYTGQNLQQYRDKQTFSENITRPQQIAIRGTEVYLLERGKRKGGGEIYCIFSNDSCELYLDKKHTDCGYIYSFDISKSRLIIVGVISRALTSPTLTVRVYDI